MVTNCLEVGRASCRTCTRTSQEDRPTKYPPRTHNRRTCPPQCATAGPGPSRCWNRRVNTGSPRTSSWSPWRREARSRAPSARSPCPPRGERRSGGTSTSSPRAGWADRWPSGRTPCRGTSGGSTDTIRIFPSGATPPRCTRRVPSTRSCNLGRWRDSKSSPSTCTRQRCFHRHPIHRSSRSSPPTTSPNQRSRRGRGRRSRRPHRGGTGRSGS
mmetsp:Transcript_4176/g.5600  ORF Transcript_4176/g.5600 Transcript_4176/m.5600 type:complete len:214 (+) Transcript_4176:70-711(+)